MQTISLPSMLMIGGSGRNVGKTTLVCAVIRNVSATTPVIGLKVTSIRPGEEEFHGHHEIALSENFRIFEETNSGSTKDTAKMLRAGASKVYFIQATDEQMPLAMEAFFKLVDRNSFFICETRGLRRLVKPGLFILITDPSRQDSKTKAHEFESLADLHIVFDAHHRIMEQQAERISLQSGEWHLKIEK